MTDAPILGPINHISDLSTASDFEKKHTPHIGISASGDVTTVTVTVGWGVPHPNQPDHSITWITIYAGEAPIARFDLAAVASTPTVSVVVDLESGTLVRAIAHCNMHGLWTAEVTL
ncbi:MAG: superoxide [Actinobacteria bacterium]|nr:MAG: superoxide [Actinomycetota bacterium]